jgi:galactosylceramidase
LSFFSFLSYLLVGAECWARVINQNYVNGNMTASINWNLIAAYMKGTNWYRAGLMNAMQPWNGAYGSYNADGSWTVGPMIWATAHTTQFSTPGSWAYLLVDSNRGGSGSLQNGGSYVTLKNFATGDFSIVIEKMSRDHSSCVRPGLPAYDTSAELATFTLSGDLASVTSLQLWYTHWAYYPNDKTVEFEQQAPVQVVNGKFTLNITVDSLYTLTTLTTGNKGSFGAPPPTPVLFPNAHTDDFENCAISSEGAYFTDQNGIWECMLSNDPTHGTIMRQMVPMRPVTWGGDIRPHSLIGHRDGKDTSMVFDAYIEEPGASVMFGVRMQGTDNSQGILFGVDTTSNWGVWRQISDVTNTGKAVATGTSPVNITSGAWHTYRIDVNASLLNVWIDLVPVITNWNTTANGMTNSGHALIGTLLYGHYTQFDNFQLYTAYTQCGTTPLTVGAPVNVVDCNAEVGPSAGSQWIFTAVPNSGQTSLIQLRSNTSLCLYSNPNSMLELATCNSSDSNQLWKWEFDGIAPDGERKSSISLANGNCLDIVGQVPDIGAQMDAYKCNNGGNQAFFFDYDAGEIANEWSSTCVGVC